MGAIEKDLPRVSILVKWRNFDSLKDNVTEILQQTEAKERSANVQH